MKRATLDTMWTTNCAHKAPFAAVHSRQATLTGQSTMTWTDTWAPVVVGDLQPKTDSFDEAAEYFVNNFAKFTQ